MTPDLRNRWVEALRSGRYKQGFNALRRGDCFCPLGVLCDLVDPEGWTQGSPIHRLANRHSSIAEKTLIRLGISLENVCDIIDLNDALKLPFPRIADYIEAAFADPGASHD